MGSGDSETKLHFIRVRRSPEVSLGMFQETLEIGLKVTGIDFRLDKFRSLWTHPALCDFRDHDNLVFFFN